MARKGFFDLSDCQWAPSDVNRVMLRELYSHGIVAGKEAPGARDG